MARTITWIEAAGILAVIVMLVGLPLLLRHWQVSMLPHHYPTNTKIISLTAVAKGGIWTQEEVVGANYWWRTPSRAEEIPINQGDHIVLRLRSADVLHRLRTTTARDHARVETALTAVSPVAASTVL